MENAMELEGTKHDIFSLVEKVSKSGALLPRLFLWCGTEDTLINANRNYHELLTKLNVEHRYEESTGNHNWKCWDEHIQDALRYLFPNE